MGKQISDNGALDYVRHRVAIRELIAWLIGAIIGLCLGVQAGLLAGDNVAPVIIGAVGWCVGGYICRQITKALVHSKPNFTISARSARDACFGLVVGTLAGGFISDATKTPQLIGIIAGMVAGILTGGAIGEKSARNAVRKEAERRSAENDVQQMD
jgi:uncharacterized protein YcfJ